MVPGYKEYGNRYWKTLKKMKEEIKFLKENIEVK